MSIIKVNDVQNFNGTTLTLTAPAVVTSAALNTGGNITVTGSVSVSDITTTLSNLGVGLIGTLSQVDLGNVAHRTGTLPVANGGTGVTVLSNIDAANLGSGSATNTHVLTADGSGGVSFQAPASGGVSEADAIAFAIAL